MAKETLIIEGHLQKGNTYTINSVLQVEGFMAYIVPVDMVYQFTWSDTNGKIHLIASTNLASVVNPTTAPTVLMSYVAGTSSYVFNLSHVLTETFGNTMFLEGSLYTINKELVDGAKNRVQYTFDNNVISSTI